MGKPFRITFIPVRGIAATSHDANVAASVERKRVGISTPNGGRLAIVGGGPSVAAHIDELRDWKGDIWAINWTGQWLSDHGVASKLVTVDSSINSIQKPRLNRGALLASCVSPSVFDEYHDVECFDMIEDDPNGIVGGSSTACRIPLLAARMGYSEVHFFGCEGSFKEGQTHVYRNETKHKNYIKINAGGTVYLTRDDLYLQCESLADVIRSFPSVFKDRSHGLLKGMIENPETWEVVAISEELKKQLEGSNGSCGAYDAPYIEENPCLQS
jgi:hypothetical protein